MFKLVNQAIAIEGSEIQKKYFYFSGKYIYRGPN
jgi:hypothetical protein